MSKNMSKVEPELKADSKEDAKASAPSSQSSDISSAHNKSKSASSSNGSQNDKDKEIERLSKLYKVEDCVKIKSIYDEQNGGCIFPERFGIIEQIGELENPEFRGMFWFQCFLTYEEAWGKAKDKLRAENEIIQAGEREKEELINISHKVEILQMPYYVEKYHPEAVAQRLKRLPPPKDVYVFRQKVTPGSKKLQPDLDTGCICRKKLNPNDTLIECPGFCSNFFHPSCLMMCPERKWYNCNTEIPLELLCGKPLKFERKREQKDIKKKDEEIQSKLKLDEADNESTAENKRSVDKRKRPAAELSSSQEERIAGNENASQKEYRISDSNASSQYDSQKGKSGSQSNDPSQKESIARTPEYPLLTPEQMYPRLEKSVGKKLFDFIREKRKFLLLRNREIEDNYSRYVMSRKRIRESILFSLMATLEIIKTELREGDSQDFDKNEKEFLSIEKIKVHADMDLEECFDLCARLASHMECKIFNVQPEEDEQERANEDYYSHIRYIKRLAYSKILKRAFRDPSLLNNIALDRPKHLLTEQEKVSGKFIYSDSSDDEEEKQQPADTPKSQTEEPEVEEESEEDIDFVGYEQMRVPSIVTLKDIEKHEEQTIEDNFSLIVGTKQWLHSKIDKIQMLHTDSKKRLRDIMSNIEQSEEFKSLIV